jgi:thiamine transporter ThiT
MVAANAVMSAIWFGVAARHIPIFTMPWRRMLGQSALTALLVGLGAWIGLAASGAAGTLVQVSMLVAFSATGFAAGLFMARHPLGAEVVRAVRTAWARLRAGRAGS